MTKMVELAHTQGVVCSKKLSFLDDDQISRFSEVIFSLLDDDQLSRFSKVIFSFLDDDQLSRFSEVIFSFLDDDGLGGPRQKQVNRLSLERLLCCLQNILRNNSCEENILFVDQALSCGQRGMSLGPTGLRMF